MSSAGYPNAAAVGEDIRPVAKAYLEAINTSVETAGYGITFAEDAVELCNSLIPSSHPDTPLFINEMRATAGQAHVGAKHTVQKFRDVQRQVLQVWKWAVYTVASRLKIYTDYETNWITASTWDI